jgi:hypothetical protein
MAGWWRTPKKRLNTGAKRTCLANQLFITVEISGVAGKREKHLPRMSSAGRQGGVVRDLPEQLDREECLCLVAVVVLIAGDGEDGYGTTDGEAEDVADLANPVEHLVQADALRESEVKGCFLM